MSKAPITTERVHLRVLQCVECNNITCWINGRLPSYCHECGKLVIGDKKKLVLKSDDNAFIKYRDQES
jgi:hypothetical protein